MKKKLAIEGMTCGHCVSHTTEALERVEGVSSVNVDLTAKSAVVSVDESVTDEALKNAVTAAGYTVTGVEAERDDA